jgi:hypothetical protein
VAVVVSMVVVAVTAVAAVTAAAVVTAAAEATGNSNSSKHCKLQIWRRHHERKKTTFEKAFRGRLAATTAFATFALLMAA